MDDSIKAKVAVWITGIWSIIYEGIFFWMNLKEVNLTLNGWDIFQQHLLDAALIALFLLHICSTVAGSGQGMFVCIARGVYRVCVLKCLWLHSCNADGLRLFVCLGS